MDHRIVTRGLVEHLNGNGVSYAVVAPAPLAEIEVVRQRMGWTFPWVSSFGADYVRDVVMAFAPDGAGGSGNQSFYRNDDGQVYLTYAGYGRGGEMQMGIYGILDQMPFGRSEDGPNFTMAEWVKPRNMYGKGGVVASNGEFNPAPQCGGEPQEASVNPDTQASSCKQSRAGVAIPQQRSWPTANQDREQLMSESRHHGDGLVLEDEVLQSIAYQHLPSTLPVAQKT